MKEVEITVRVNETLEECKSKLEKQNFKVIRKSKIEDIYMTQKLSLLNKDNIDEILKSCILIRYLNVDGKEFKKLTYKNKEYSGDDIISEKKINVNCDNLNNAKELLEAVGFQELVRVKYNVTVFSDGIRELAFQEVENLGLLLEYESNKNLEDATNEQIIEEKENMLLDILNLGIKVENNLDVKKAYELILKNIDNKN